MSNLADHWRSPKQLVVVSDCHESVYDMVRILRDGFPSGGRSHHEYNVDRIYSVEDLKAFMDGRLATRSHERVSVHTHAENCERFV